jgi:guanylate kinase
VTVTVQHERADCGNVFIVSAPSGAGKSSLVRALLAQDRQIALSISFTTRAPRPGEQGGREYHFISIDEFQKRAARGEFLESAQVHGNYYATSRVWIEMQIRSAQDVLLEIDWQGALQAKRAFPQAVGIFILPPSLEALQQRLNGRGQDSPEVVARRLTAAGDEMAHARDFDYVIVNEKFDSALADLQSLVKAARLRYRCQATLQRELFSRLGIVE